MQTYVRLFMVLVFFIGSSRSLLIPDDDFNVTIFANEIEHWVKNGSISPRFNGFINDLAIPTAWQRLDWNSFSDSIRSSAYCTICKSIAKSMITLRQSGTSIEAMETSMTNLCILLNIQSKDVCEGVVHLNLPVLFYIIDNDPPVTHDDFCGLMLQSHDSCRPTKRYQWEIKVNQGDRRFFEEIPHDERIKILQVTDIHYDPRYEPNGNADCDEPTCCRIGQNRTEGNTKLAGYWGDYNYCDSPWHAVIDAFDHMKNQQTNVEFVYFTGDIIDHGVWETTRYGNIRSLVKMYEVMKNTFGNTPVYSILGNHEPQPLNLFATNSIKNDELSTRWLYEVLSNIWIEAGWLPESTKETILRGGYYTLSPKPGFRIIALNNNVAYIFNWWLVYEPIDPSGQLQWLHDVLLEAELNDEKVHILNHIPSGNDECQFTWGREYKRIINRFSHIITAQFNGHTHADEFNLMYDPNDFTKLINVAWNGGGITPYAFLNPNYKVYSINGYSYAVEDVDTWMYDLAKANLTPEKRPEWLKLYSFKDEYNLNDLSKKSLNNWMINMAKNSSVQQQFRKNYFKNAAPELEKECDKKCLQEFVCRIVTSHSEDKQECKYFKELL